MNTRLSEPTNRRTLRAMARFAAPLLAVLALLSLSLSSSSSPAQAQTAPVMTITAPASQSEGDSYGLVFLVTWVPDLTEDVTLKVEVSETGNMLAAGEAGIRSLPQYAFFFAEAEVLVQLDDDSVNEPDSVVTVTVLPGDGYTVGASGSVTVTDDDESATVTPEAGELVIYEKASANTSRPGTGHYVDGTPSSETYTIVLDSAPTGTVTVTASIDKPARATFDSSREEELATKTLTFTTANWSVAQTVTVNIRDTDDHEHPSVTTDTFPDVSPQLVTVSHTASGGGYDGAAIPDVEVTAYDAGNIVYYEFKDLDISVPEGERYEVTIVQTSRSDIPWFFDVSVTVSTRGGGTSGTTAHHDSDYESVNNILWLRWYHAKRVPDGRGGYVWRSETTFRYQTLQDQRLEGDEHFRLIIERSASLDHRHLLVAGRHLPRVTIVDDEWPGGLLAIDGHRARPITEVSGVAEEGGSPATFTVAMRRWPDNVGENDTFKVRVLGPETFDESAGDNGAVVPWKVTPGPEEPLVFNRNTFSTPQTVTVTALDDRDDRDELAPIALQLEVSAPFEDVLVARVRVEDDDKGAAPAVPGALTDAEAEAIEGGGIKVSWTPPDVERHAGIDGYAIERSEDGTDWSALATPGFEKTLCGEGVRCYGDYTARPGYQSYYRVAGVNDAGGTGPWTAAVAATALPEVWLELVTTETETAPVEGASLEYKLHRTGSAGALSVRLRISETGAMVAPSYVDTAFQDGRAVKSFSIATTNDTTEEPDSRVAVSINVKLTHYLRVQGESRPDTSRPYSVAVSVKDNDGAAQEQGALLPEVILTTAETAAAEGAALEFTLTRTGPTEEALGVDVSVSETGAMLAAYPSRAVIPAGENSAAFSVLTLDDEAVEADSVMTAAIAEDAERYTVGEPSSASVTVLDDDGAPLTAEFRDSPAAHDGEDAFTFRIAFSEAVATSYRTLRDHALEVTGGRVREAKRVDGRSDLWRITIEPDSDADVTVVLPVTDSCDDQGAICTGDGGILSNRVEMTIPGPVAEEETQQTPPENNPATGAPGVRGTAQVGETLTADTSGIADADGLDNASFSYQWLADGAGISGATSSTYILQDADEGKTVRVRVSFTDDAGNQETLTSGATAAVEAAVAEEEPTEPPPAPTNLTAVVNADGSVTLTWDAPDDDSVTGYLILRRRPYEGEKTLLVYVENTGSTATTWTDTNVTAGTQHVYRVKAINGAGVGNQSNYVNVDP